MVDSQHADAAIIGGGPAGLRAVEILAAAGKTVALYDQKPSVGRKFLVAGKGGLARRSFARGRKLSAWKPTSAPADAFSRAASRRRCCCGGGWCVCVRLAFPSTSRTAWKVFVLTLLLAGISTSAIHAPGNFALPKPAP